MDEERAVVALGDGQVSRTHLWLAEQKVLLPRICPITASQNDLLEVTGISTSVLVK